MTVVYLRGMTALGRVCSRVLSDRAGNLAMTAAIVLPALLGAMAVAIDYTTAVNDQRHLQDAVDGAAVAAAASLVAGKHDETTVKDYAKNFVLAELATSLTSTQLSNLSSKLAITITTSGSGSSKGYKIKVVGGYTEKLSPFAQFLGYSTVPLGAVSTTESQSTSKNAMSMYAVLDRSGSMSFVTDTLNTAVTKCQNYTSANWSNYPNLNSTKPCYVNKMGALKKAAASLFDELDAVENKDATDSVVRLGGVSFNDSMQTPQAIAWGTSSMRTYVGNLPAYPTGGTDMTDGMEQAYKALSASSEVTAQTAKGNTSFSKFIVLMTDGENTGSSSNWNPALDTLTLATCTKARAAGITIYTVAFMAPTNGEKLLKACAGVTSNYYAAKDMTSLIAAFADIGNKATKKATRITN
jgi:Flp pilus assembly protein TadG